MTEALNNVFKTNMHLKVYIWQLVLLYDTSYVVLFSIFGSGMD